jgi:hypothetical protein
MLLSCLLAAAVVVICLLPAEDGGGPSAPGDVRPPDEAHAPTLETGSAPNALRAPGRGPTAHATGASAGSATPWRLAGRVSHPDGAPVAGAEVEVDLCRGDLRRHLASAHSDPQGHYEADLGALADLPEVPRGAAHLEVRARAAGHLPPPRRDVPVPREAPAHPLRLDLVLKAGACLTGRVVDADGAPVPRAWVSGDGAGRMQGFTDAHGRYVLGIPASGVYALHTSVGGRGTGALKDLRLLADEDAQAPDLVLHGPGTLEGTAVYPDGTPAAGVDLHAWSESGDEGAPGITFGSARSDKGGRFRFAGLRRGTYVVGAWWLHPDPGHATAWPTGAQDVRVVLRSTSILVRVVDRGGHPVPGATFTLQGEDGRREFSQAGSVLRADGMVAVGVHAGGHVHLTADAGPGLKASLDVTAPEGVHAIRRDLVLGGAGGPPTGRLRILVSAPDGTRIPTFSASLRREGTLMEMVDASFLTPAKDDGLLPPVPTGRFVVEVRPGLAGLDARPTALWFSIEAPAEVRAGQETVLRVTARPGGRLRLTLHAPAGQPSPADLHVEARPLSGEPAVALTSFVTRTKDGWSLASAATPGVPCVAGPLLEPGRYTVRVTATGVRPAEVLTDVAAGQLRDVEVWLQAR